MPHLNPERLNGPRLRRTRGGDRDEPQDGHLEITGEPFEAVQRDIGLAVFHRPHPSPVHTTEAGEAGATVRRSRRFQGDPVPRQTQRPCDDGAAKGKVTTEVRSSELRQDTERVFGPLQPSLRQALAGPNGQEAIGPHAR